jgi:NAD(P)-dependent dehydrogenase (short-subunit alcohol dehydrogenase family)
MSTKDYFNVKNKIVAIIGAASGIGKATSLEFAKQGATVHCFDINAAGVQSVVKQIKESGCIVQRHNQLDAVICTPSVNVRKSLLTYSSDEFDKVVSLNLKGSFNVLRTAGRHMTQAGAGSIVLFSSIRSQVVEPGQSVYAATKAGIVQLVRTAAAEFGPSGVRVNALAPGIVETPLTEPIKSVPDWYEAYAAKTVLGRWATPEEMVGPIIFLSSDASSYVTGTVLFADGGWTAADGRYQPPGV